MKGNWRNWTIGEWNDALFEHFFRDSDSEDRSVNRILMTRDELVKVVSDSKADVQEVQEAFLSAVRTSSHIRFNHRLSGYLIDPKTGWNSASIPPFFVELAFSCLVAAPLDGKSRFTGDFRKRLAMLLGHDISMPYYPLGNLADLWVAFSRWLDWRREVGEPYRRLELPPLDHLKRIGYSIKLAFPSRKDQIILNEILSKGAFEEDPPIPAVFEIIGKSISRFSPRFRTAYDEFRDAFRSKRTDLERFPFWGAVRDAIKSNIEQTSDEEGSRRVLKLILEPDGFVLLLSTVPGEVIKNRLLFVEFDSPYGEYGCALSERTDSSPDFDIATQNLLSGRYVGALSGRRWQAIDMAIKQGLLLFKKDESGVSWELTFTRQEDGYLQGLVKESWATVILDAFPLDCRPQSKPSRYQGWIELQYFPGKWLASLKYADDSLLSEIRCLQSTAYGPSLTFVNGCPVDGGFLGVPTYLPLVRAPLSNAVRVEPIGLEERRESIQLTRLESGSVDFSFPVDLQKSLGGPYRVLGLSSDGRVLVRKEVVFRPEIVVNAYTRPSDTTSWETEAGGPDVVTYGEESISVTCPNRDRKKRIRTEVKKTASMCSGQISLPLVNLPLHSWTRIEALAQMKGHDCWEPCEFTEAERFMEICGGLAMRRNGIHEADFLDLVRVCLKVNRYEQQWDVVRAWIEGGYLDRLQYKKWRRIEYFPCVPRVILESQGDHVRGGLFGLATVAFRNRADVELLKLGAERVQVVSRSKWVIPPPVWRAPSADPYVRVSKILGLEEPVWRKTLAETLWLLADVVSDRGEAPQYYERRGCWSWEHGCFSRDLRPTLEGVEVIRYQRLDRPPYYKVTIDGKQAWWSTSRNWSLLLAHELKGDSVFALAGADRVVRVSKGQVYLPLPLGRFLAITGMTVPGPDGDFNGSYIYQFRDSKERLRLLSAIWGSIEADTIEMSRWARWILALSKNPSLDTGVRMVPLPRSIRRQLERFDDVPEFRKLSRAKIDPSLFPHVKNGLSRFTKSRGV